MANSKVPTVTYLGKAGKPDTEQVPVQGLWPPFRQGEARYFTDDYLKTQGIDPAQADQFLAGLFGPEGLYNANRGDSPLFELASAAPPGEGQTAPNAEETGTVKGSGAGKNKEGDSK